LPAATADWFKDIERKTVLTRIIVALVRGCTRYAWLTIVAGLILAVVAGAYSVRHFAIDTDIGKLISNDLPWRQREIAFDKAFPGQNDLILAVIEAPTPEQARQAGLDLEKKLVPQTDKFIWVRFAGSGPFFDTNGLLFLPTDEVAKQTEQLASASPISIS